MKKLIITLGIAFFATTLFGHAAIAQTVSKKKVQRTVQKDKRSKNYKVKSKHEKANKKRKSDWAISRKGPDSLARH